MLNTLSRVLLGACALAVTTQPAAATMIFGNDFSSGVGPQEELIGSFTVADGYLGHHNGYSNNEYSSYRIIYDFAGVTNAFLDFDYWIDTENIFGYVQVWANDVAVGGFTGYGASHAHCALDYLTQPDVIGRSVISFDFMSNFAITRGGFQINNLTITGDTVLPTTGVPEPASWALMIIGFGALGAAMRRRRPATVLLGA